MTGFPAALAERAEAVNRVLAELMPRAQGPERRVLDAMLYATLNGGKRLRPFLVLATSELFQVPRERALRAAAAVEYVHCYSLVHDDLPAMDDDDLRRGQPTTHIKFDEATAILAGDGLLTMAFEVLAGEATHPNPSVRSELVLALALASGAEGMVGGQSFDLQAETTTFGLDDIIRLQAMKTGALFRFSCEAGGILGEATAAQRKALRDYARDLGLAFQIADDLLDHEGTEAEVGKKVGKDAAQGKATFVSLLGADEARKRARSLALAAGQAVEIFGERARLLAETALFVVERRN